MKDTQIAYYLKVEKWTDFYCQRIICCPIRRLLFLQVDSRLPITGKNSSKKLSFFPFLQFGQNWSTKREVLTKQCDGSKPSAIKLCLQMLKTLNFLKTVISKQLNTFLKQNNKKYTNCISKSLPPSQICKVIHCVLWPL